MSRLFLALFWVPLALGLNGCDLFLNPRTNNNSPPSARTSISRDKDVQTGTELFKQGKFSEAIIYFERALDKPLRGYDRSVVLTAIGNCYNELEKFETSLDYHQRVIREDPKNY